EEALLEPLILSQNEPTNEEMKKMLNNLSDEWNLSSIFNIKGKKE
ncbi:8578_t:CDS:1, partial [Funneliformis caledonium]